MQPKQQELAEFKQNQQDQVEMLLGDRERANKILEQQKKQNQVRVIRSTGVNHSNMMNESNHALKKASYENYIKQF